MGVVVFLRKRIIDYTEKQYYKQSVSKKYRDSGILAHAYR